MASAKNIPEPIKTAQYDPDISLVDNWDLADPLGSGWFEYAPINLVEQYRDAGRDEQRSAYLQVMMQMIVKDKIGTGDVIAIGIRFPLAAAPVPEILPPILFKIGSIKIDWDIGEVRALGEVFGEVRLCVADQNNEPLKPAKAPAPKAKRGRRSYDAELEEAFNELAASEINFANWSQEKQLLAIQTKSAALHPGLFPKSGPGRSTVARFLKRRRESVP